MDLRSDSPNPMYGSKVLVVKLERCDKIWKTLQVIKHMQEKHFRDIKNWIKREPITSKKIVSKQPPMTFIPDKSLPLNLIGEPDIPKPYIKYHPVLNNGNESMPQFKLAEKKRVNLYHCEVCSNEFCNYKNFADHQDQLHGIILPKKIAPKKERLSNKSADSTNFQNSVQKSQQQLNKKLIPDENIDSQNAIKTVTKSIKCKLCHKFYRDIRKHTAQYHKVESINGSNKVSDKNSSEQDHSAMEIDSPDTLPEVKPLIANQGDKIVSQNFNVAAQNSTNPLKRKSTMPRIEFRKKLRSVRNKNVLKSGFQNNQMKCEICHRQFVYYNSLCKHRYQHKNPSKDEQYLEMWKNKEQSADSIARNEAGLETSALAELAPDNNDKDDDVDYETQVTKARSTKEHNTFTDIFKNGTVLVQRNGKLKTKNKCLCGRSFRSSYILFTHKKNCKFIKNVNDKSLETPISGDRDSGISIKIKKNNNSYEIVGKEDVKGEDKGVLGEESSDSSSNSSDSSEFDNHPESLVPEESKYSKEHQVLKIKFIEEDIYVEIEDEVSKRNDGESEGQVPSLRDLCTQFFIQRGLLPKQETTHKCRFCQVFLGCRERLSKHIERHKKLMKRSCTCGIKFSSIEIFDDHLTKMHPKCITCPYCKERYTSIVGWNEHVCLVSRGERYTETCNGNYPCPNCNIVFNNITWLDSHLKSEHLDPNLPFQCYQCVEKFPNEIARSLHFHKTHNQALLCSVCNQKLQSIKTKQKHEAYHRGVGFPCHKCKKAYQSKKTQLYHISTVHNEYSNDKLQCFICQKTIKTRSYKKHVLRHNSRLECKMCDKILYNFRNLERHIMDHHREEDYPCEKCNVCGVSFPTKEQLEAHIVVENSTENEHKNDE